MGLFFDEPRRIITKREFQLLKSALHSNGFRRDDINNVIKIFWGDMEEEGVYHGIDQKEVARGIKWLRENMSKHTLSEDQVNILEEKMKKYL